MATTTRKECRGVPKLDIAPHSATLDAFGASAASKDGLQGICKTCDKAYQTAWRASKKSGVPMSEAELAVESGDRARDEEHEEAAVDALDAQEQEHAALEAAIDAAGGNGSDEGQALLAQAADAAAQARRDARNARRREARAAAKLPTTTDEFTADVRDILNR